MIIAELPVYLDYTIKLREVISIGCRISQINKPILYDGRKILVFSFSITYYGQK